MLSFKWLCTVLLLVSVSEGQETKFEIPEVTLEAYRPSGFKASIPAIAGIEVFAFHGNINKKLIGTEPGEVGEDIRVADNTTEGYISYYNPELTLKIGDYITYWVYVQHDHYGYRKDDQKWSVTELRPPTSGCKLSGTKSTVSTEVCSGTEIFVDHFNKGKVDDSKWTLEQYIPDSPDFEFVVYKKDPEVVFLNSENLSIKPKLIQDESELKKKFLDITDGCTKPEEACKRELFLIHNPVVSGRVVSKFAFVYGEVEIKARLPSGDWIYPEIYLEGKNDQRIYICYARGNKQLTGSDLNDIGGSLLFGGPALKPTEPQKSEKLSSLRGNEPFSEKFHVYRLRWTPDEMQLFVDNRPYGQISTGTIKFSGSSGSEPPLFHLVLGVGVGGLNDFPDGFRSGNNEKPWRNGQRAQVKTFFGNKTAWYDGTWNSKSQLEVDYVWVKSI